MSAKKKTTLNFLLGTGSTVYPESEPIKTIPKRCLQQFLSFRGFNAFVSHSHEIDKV